MENLPPTNHHHDDDDPAATMPYEATAHHHDFHYYGATHYHSARHTRNNRYGCCLCHPLVQLVRWFCQNTDLHRSASLGSIDGLVTGASLVAALHGLHVWTPTHAAVAVRIWLVAVATAVAVAEALCMAVGHVRTTQQGALQAWQARQEVALQVTTHRAATKGHLVDLLLQRGLLKIDAMSIADTLEGYPDVCVSLLAGESLEQHAAAANVHEHVSAALMQQQQHQHQQPDWHHYDELDDPEGNGSNSRAVRQAVAEAWTEAMGMMVGFGVAAILPSLLVWGILPPPLTTHQEYSYVTSSYHTVPDRSSNGNNHGTAASAFVEPTTLLLLVLSLVMMVLAWSKATLTAAPSYFGTIVEGILLLWLGYGTAYGMGVALRQVLPDYLLSVATESESKLYCV